MNRVERANQFCGEILAELKKTTDDAERSILLSVLTNQLTQWNLDMQLELIQRKSRALSECNS